MLRLQFWTSRDCAVCKPMLKKFEKITKQLVAPWELMDADDPDNARWLAELGIQSVPAIVAFDRNNIPTVIFGEQKPIIIKDVVCRSLEKY